MSTLHEFLVQKREAQRERQVDADRGEIEYPHRLAANVMAGGRSGVRQIRIRDVQILSDSGPELAGYRFGPGSPEIQLGVLGSCLTHVFEIQAALAEIPLDALSVDVTGEVDHRAGKPGFEHIPVHPHNIRYVVNIESPAPEASLRELHEVVERVCPIFNLLRHPQRIEGTLAHTITHDEVAIAV